MAAKHSDLDYVTRLLNKAKALSMAALCGFKLNHTMSTDSKMFDEMTIIEMDSCGANFQTLLDTLAELSINASKGWIFSIISFYNKDIYTQDRYNVPGDFQFMSEQAPQYPLAYQMVAISVTDILEFLKKAYLDTNQGDKSLVNLLKRKIADAEQLAGNDVEVGPDKYNDNVEEESAKESMEKKLKDYYSSSSNDRMNIIAENAGKLVVALQQLPAVIKDLAEFFSTQSKLYLSKTRGLVDNFNWLHLGARDPTATAPWAEVESALSSYGDKMFNLTQFFKFETDVVPEPTKVFKFPNTTIQLTLQDSVGVQEFMDKYVSQQTFA